MTLDGKPDWMQYASIPRKMQEQGHSTYSYGWVNNVTICHIPDHIKDFKRHEFENGFFVEDIASFIEDVEVKAMKNNPNWDHKYQNQNGSLGANGKIARIKAARALGDTGKKGYVDPVSGEIRDIVALIGLKEIKDFVEKYWPNGGNDSIRKEK